MQALLFVAKHEKGSAEALEPSELATNLRLSESILREGSELYDDYVPWVAYYAMTCASVMKNKGFEPGIEIGEFLSQRPDNSFKPRWHERFIKQHRSYLVLLGWIRYFNERGATRTSLMEHRIEPPMTLVKSASGPADIAARFTVLDSRLNALGFPEGQRPYSDFQEQPAAFKLHPDDS